MIWSDDFDVPNPPVTEQLIQAVESLLEVRLPEAYLALMRSQNGGYVSEELIRVRETIPESLEPYISDGYVTLSSIAGLNTDVHAHGSIAHTIYLRDEWDLPRGLVLLDGDGHTFIALDYRRTAVDPPVVFIVSATKDTLPIAANFADLLEKLVPYESVYDEDGNLR